MPCCAVFHLHELSLCHLASVRVSVSLTADAFALCSPTFLVGQLCVTLLSAARGLRCEHNGRILHELVSAVAIWTVAKT